MQSEVQKSIAERAGRIKFGHFSRTRPDDRVVELFLASWQDGCLAANPDWLPQNIRNVEVVASDVAGNKLAIEHTSIHAFEHHQREEKWMAQIGAEIEAAVELQALGRRFFIIFNRDLFDDLNEKKRRAYTQALISWLLEALPGLPMGDHRVATPLLLPRKKLTEVVIQVDEVLDGLPSVSVGGMLPGDARERAVPQVERALKAKLPKLSGSQAGRKILLVELPTLDTSPNVIIELIQNSSTFQAQLKAYRFRCARQNAQR